MMFEYPKRNFMSEKDVIKKTKNGPITVDSIKKDLLALGVKPGMVLFVHSSLSKMGWVNGGAQAVIQALGEFLGTEGTLVMPTHSSSLSDPEEWSNPPVPQDWKETIRQTMPPYDPDLTPCRSMGRIPETFRKGPGVLRSDHPHMSFSARGAQAEIITKGHQMDFGLGEKSPLARLYDLDARILLLGVNHENNTTLHLSETRADYPGKKEIKQGAPIMIDGERKWVKFTELDDHSDDFQKIAKAYKKLGGNQLAGKIGNAKSRLIPQRDLVDFAVGWMEENWDFSNGKNKKKEGR
jgi:aminoglycoside 3-N-acetyltransferase